MKQRTISVIGTGYLGATHAAGMAELGYHVVGVDNDPAKVESLARGDVPFHEPGLPELLRRHVDSGRLRFTTRIADAAEADVHFVCVGTPQAADGSADLTALHAVVDSLVPLLRRDCLLVGKSTVPVGTAEALTRRVAVLAPEGVDVRLAWNPEFLREAHGVEDTLHPNRLVLGTTDPYAERVLREVYATPIAEGSPVVVTDLPTAELVKVSANAFLATKISFVNAMAELCELTGADVSLLAEALGHDDRIGHKFLGAGLGFGGGCLPKDIRALVARAEQIGGGEAVGFLREVDKVNLRRRDRVVALVEQLVGDPAGVRIGVLGAAFKPGSDDVRDSPALDVAKRLVARGARVSVYDPAASVPARAVAPQMRHVANAFAACRKADVVLHLTEWPEFRELDPVALAARVSSPRVIDARNALDADRWAAAGWEVLRLGRPPVLPTYQPAAVLA